MLSSPWWRTWDRATWLTRINHFRERLVSRFSSLCREKRKDNRLYNRCVTGTSATWDHFMWKLPPTRPDHTPFITEPSTQGGWCAQALRWWCVGLQNPVQRVLALLEPWEEVRRFKKSGLSMTQQQVILFLVMCGSHGLNSFTVASCSGGVSVCDNKAASNKQRNPFGLLYPQGNLYRARPPRHTRLLCCTPYAWKVNTERRMQDRGVIYLHLPAACYCTYWWK